MNIFTLGIEGMSFPEGEIEDFPQVSPVSQGLSGKGLNYCGIMDQMQDQATSKTPAQIKNRLKNYAPPPDPAQTYRFMFGVEF